ncbi:hypothetical protein [Allocoleopsis franciscana]|uniref:Uncharacterized protein n=1 Tax=Allocoleopsis franciscana PCC 7113 TaxID=1173027 RepID=K9W8Y7_9CYAN|nr:hypothetical protein [Allocoleopsis franciscana]AFZ16271.1 hypothetical protein Mic7113_0347 [Allocoleopsis franciscana PCC 7113]
MASHDLAEHLNQKLWLVEQQSRNNLSSVEMPKRMTAGITINFYVELLNSVKSSVTFNASMFSVFAEFNVKLC